MPRVISIHEYVLKPDVQEEQFVCAIRDACKRKIFELPGLIDFRFLKGLRGSRQGCFSAMWIYENRTAWENLWGSLEEPISKDQYPTNWKIWEDEFLAPLIQQEPDNIQFTAYQEILG